jgi:IMP dehydrogenase
MYLDPARPGVEDIIDQIVAGVRFGMHVRRRGDHHRASTSGPWSGVQSHAGYDEGRPLGTSW